VVCGHVDALDAGCAGPDKGWRRTPVQELLDAPTVPAGAKAADTGAEAAFDAERDGDAIWRWSVALQ